MTSTRPSNTGPLVVITPPPTPNGRLHVGHVAGPYLRADLFTRLVRLVAGREVHHTTHLDTYQSYVPKKARELGRDVDSFMAETGAGLRRDFRSFGIEHDTFIDNESPEYLTFLESAVEYALPRLTVAAVPARACGQCAAPLFESNLRGFCPHCLHDAFQNVCENCCLPQEPDTMVRSSCATCGDSAAVVADGEDLAITVSADDIVLVSKLVGDRFDGNPRLASMFGRLAPHRVALTYTTDYGVFPKALPGSLNPWVEIYFAHLFAVLSICGVNTGQPFASVLEDFNARRPAPEVVTFFGVDNSYYYAFLFPLLSERLGIPAMIPTAIKANFFLLLNNAKVSSSRNNVMWAADMLAGNDLAALRTSLAASCPEFSARNYAPAGTISPGRGAVDGGETWQSVEALSARLAQFADPHAFSVEGLLNIFGKATSYVIHLRSAGAEAEANAVEAWLTAVAARLLLA